MSGREKASLCKHGSPPIREPRRSCIARPLEHALHVPLQEKCGGNKSKGRQIMRTSSKHPQSWRSMRRWRRRRRKSGVSDAKQDSGVSECVDQDKFELRQFHVRGWTKLKQEALWAGITYNIQQWIRRIWRRTWRQVQIKCQKRKEDRKGGQGTRAGRERKSGRQDK